MRKCDVGILKNYIPVAAGRAACSSLPEYIRSEFDSRIRIRQQKPLQAKTTKSRRLTLIKLLQERPLHRSPAVLLDEDSEELVVHLPTVHGLLVFHALLCDEDVDYFRVGHGAVGFEPLADGVAEVGWGDVEGVEGADFWGLWVEYFPRWSSG